MRSVHFDGTLLEVRFTATNSVWTLLINMVKGFPGREYDPKRRLWTVPPIKSVVEVLTEHNFSFTPAADVVRRSLLSPPEAQPERLTAPEVPDAVLSGFREYQIAGVRFLESRKGYGLIADQMGLGKTITAIGWFLLHPEVRPVVVCCPNSMKYVWARELKKWTGESVAILSGRKPGALPAAKWYVINYDILGQRETTEAGKKIIAGWCRVFTEAGVPAVVGDEIQAISNAQAIRSRAFSLMAKAAKGARVFLSGTPIRNRPAEFYPVLNLLAPKIFPNMWKYLHRYCGPKHNGFGWEFKGATNIEELHELVSPLMIRRLKSEVLAELPPKQKTIVPMELDVVALKNYESAQAEFQFWVAEHVQAGLESQEHVERLKQLAYIAKRNSIIQWVEEFLESGEKLVLGVWHRRAIDDLMERFGRVAVKIDGSVPAEDRATAVERFQTDPKCQLFVGQIAAAGVGLTLTAASHLALVEFPWTAADVEQFEDRIHRIGQEADRVFIYYLIADGTVETDIVELLQQKYDVINQVMDGEAQGDLFGGQYDNLVDGLIEKYRRSGKC